MTKTLYHPPPFTKVGWPIKTVLKIETPIGQQISLNYFKDIIFRPELIKNLSLQF